jgi:hypothetical protein
MGFLCFCRTIRQVVEQEAMGEDIAATNTPEQKAGRGVIEELRRVPWKGMGTPE